MLRVFVVDDEAPARHRLRKQLSRLEADDRLVISGEAKDGLDALLQLKATPVDLLFLDVQMPGLTGFDVLERLPPETRPVVVFVTAYDNYAVRAFEANAVDYLLKPVTLERLFQSVERAERLVRLPEHRTVSDERFGRLLDWLEHQEPDFSSGEAPTEHIRQLSIPYRDRLLVVPVEHVIAAEVVDGLTRLVLVEGPEAGAKKISQYVVSYTLDQLENRLNPQDFMRVHRSSIIALRHIREMITWFSGRYKLKLTGGHEVIASRQRSKLLKDRLTL